MLAAALILSIVVTRSQSVADCEGWPQQSWAHLLQCEKCREMLKSLCVNGRSPVHELHFAQNLPVAGTLGRLSAHTQAPSLRAHSKLCAKYRGWRLTVTFDECAHVAAPKQRRIQQGTTLGAAHPLSFIYIQ